MQKLLLIISIVILSGNAWGQSESKRKENRISSKNNGANELSQKELLIPSKKERKDGALNVVLNKELAFKIWESEPAKFSIQFPMPNGLSEKLDFEKNNIATDDFYISTSDGRKLYGKEYLGVHYKLVCKGNTRLGGLSFREDGIMGMISHDAGNYNIGEEVPGRGNYIISDDSRMEFPGWNCGTSDSKPTLEELNPKTGINKIASNSTLCKPVRIFFEADVELYQKSSNSVSIATNFVTGLFNVVKQVYLNEQIILNISGVFVWTTTDPYAAETNSSTILSKFNANRPVSGINGDLIHLLDFRSASLGGMAFIGVLCNTGARHGYSSIFYSYNAMPSYSWSVFCVSHEVGHNFGSRHTHWCGWSLPNGTTGRIDSCYAGEGTCGSTKKMNLNGTIMSYCYNNGAVNLNRGFGSLPGNTIRTGLSNATCIGSSGCLGVPTLVADSSTNLDKNYKITVNIPANHNATSWSLLEGTTVIQTGVLSNQNAASIQVPISNKPNGTFNYSAQLVAGTTVSASSQIAVVVAVPAPAPTNGNCTASGLQAWFDANNKMRFKFNLSPTCTTYNVQVCRYDLQNQSTTPIGTATPIACGVRNGMAAYSPTTAERTAGFIERVADPQPSNASTPGMGSFWYSVDVLCSGSGCTTTNRTRTYIFVPGI